jgi:hypothetical protein
VLIRPGSKVPVDAVVEEGESQVDESTVTGESLPVKKTVGDELIGATINKNGTLRARTTAVGADTALAQVVKLVQEAQNSKAPGQRLADKAAFWLVFTPLPEQAVGDVVLPTELGHRPRAPQRRENDLGLLLRGELPALANLAQRRLLLG